jgi:hypothetical protein
MKSNEICDNCIFFTIDVIDENGSEIYSQCRRHAPRMLSGSGEGWSSQLFPKVKHTFWCGEFEPLPSAPDTEGE